MKIIQQGLFGILLAWGLAACVSEPRYDLADVVLEYQLVICPTFSEPVELLLQHTRQGGTVLSEFRYRGMGGYSPRRITKPKTWLVPEQAWEAFKKAFDSNSPWSIPMQQPYMTGVDGYTVKLEMRHGGRKKVVSRWCPHSENSEIRLVKAVNEIIKLSPREKLRSDWLMD